MLYIRGNNQQRAGDTFTNTDSKIAILWDDNEANRK